MNAKTRLLVFIALTAPAGPGLAGSPEAAPDPIHGRDTAIRGRPGDATGFQTRTDFSGGGDSPAPANLAERSREVLRRALELPETNARLRSAYILGFLRARDPALLARLARAADSEPETTDAYPYVVGAAFILDANPTRSGAWREKLDRIRLRGSPLARGEACRCLALRDGKAGLPFFMPLLDASEVETRIGAAAAILAVLRGQRDGSISPARTRARPAAGSDFDQVDWYLTGIAEGQWQSRAEAIAAIETAESVRIRAAAIRRTIIDEIGGFPPKKTPLRPRITGRLERDGYRVEKVIYESVPDYFVTANLYVPSIGPGPFPGVLGTAGHGENGKAYSFYQTEFIALAKRGFVVLAFDPPAQGERKNPINLATGKPAAAGAGDLMPAGHIQPGLQCLLTGGNLARWILWDGIRGVDYLLTRPEVDPDRLAVIGNSGGGTQSAYLAAVEPRFAAAVPSCYITSWEELWFNPGPQDSEQVFANFLRDGLDFSDFLIAFLPKPIEMLAAIRDFFPIAGGRATYAEARRIFALAGAEDRIGFFEYDDEHGWSRPRRQATTAWLERWMHRRSEAGLEPSIRVETDADLRCTPTGQVATSLGGKTLQLLNQELAEQLYPNRTFARISDRAEMRRVVAARLKIADPGPIPRPGPEIARGESGRRFPGTNSAGSLALSITSEPGIEVPIELLVPDGTAKTLPAVIIVRDPGGEPAPDPTEFLRAGFIVAIPRLRGGLAPGSEGMRKGGAANGGSIYNHSYQTDMRAILVGKTMAGMRVRDLLSVFDHLSSRPEIDSRRISLLGLGNGGVISLFAAALEPRFNHVVMAGSILSYLDLVRAAWYRELTDIIVPGVLLDFDLPDLARLVEGRITLWQPRSPIGEIAPAAEAAREYGSLARILDRPGLPGPDLLN